MSTAFAKRYVMAFSTVAPSSKTIMTISMSPWLALKNKGMKVENPVNRISFQVINLANNASKTHSFLDSAIIAI